MAEQNDSSVSFALQEQLAVLHKLLQEKPGGCTGDTRRAEHLITASERREEKDAKFQELREHLNKVLTEQVAESHQHRESADSNIDGVAAVLQLMEENHQSRLNEIAAIIQDHVVLKEKYQETLLLEIANSRKARK